MGVESKTYTALSGATALTAIVGSRIYPDARRQSEGLPAVVFYRAPGGEHVNSLAGSANMENAIVEVVVSATSVDVRRTAGDAVFAAMTAATSFSAIMPDPPFDDYDDETRIYERTMDFSVWNQTTY